jgi:outer membrane protein TolC
VTLGAGRRCSPTRRRGVLAFGLLVSSGCASYAPHPLPSLGTFTHAPRPDVPRLTAAAASLEHPALAPIVLDLSDGLSPREAAVLAVLRSPELTAARDAHGEAAAQLVAAGLLPNPSVNVEADRPYGAGSGGTVTATNAGLGLAVDPLLRRSARVAQASSRLASVDLEIAWREWQVAGAAALAATRLGWVRRRLALTAEEVSFQETTAETLRHAMEEGDATLPDVGVQQASLEALRARADDLRQTDTTTAVDLRRLLDWPADRPVDVSLPDPDGEGAAPPLPPDGQLVHEALEARLDLRALRAGYDSQEAAVRVAVLSQFPALSVGFVHQRNETALRFLGGFVNLSLPIFNHAQAAVAAERATRQRLSDEYAARVAGIRVDVQALAATDRVLAEQVAEARRAVSALAPIESAERDGVKRGDVDRVSYQIVRGALFDQRMRVAALSQARLETRVGLETASGRLIGVER